MWGTGTVTATESRSEVIENGWSSSSEGRVETGVGQKGVIDLGVRILMSYSGKSSRV